MLNKYKETVDDAKVCTSLDPTLVKGYVREGKGHLFLGDYNSALRCYQRAKELEPRNPTIDVDVNSQPYKRASHAALLISNPHISHKSNQTKTTTTTTK